MADDTRVDAERFFAREYPRLVGGLTLHVGDRHLAEQLAQEALLKALRNWERVGALESPGGWTWRVALNLARSDLRRQLAGRRATQRLAARGTDTHTDPDGAGAQAVRSAVASLPHRQKTALVLRYYLDASVDETARQMQISPDAVRSLTKRGVAALRTRLTPDELAGSTLEVRDVR